MDSFEKGLLFFVAAIILLISLVITLFYLNAEHDRAFDLQRYNTCLEKGGHWGDVQPRDKYVDWGCIGNG